MIYFLLLFSLLSISLLLLLLFLKYNKKSITLNNNIDLNIINKLNGNNEILKIKIDDIENVYYFKKCDTIHLELIDNNYDIIETSSIVKGKRNYTFFPINMEQLIMKKYNNLKINHEIISEINTLNTIYNINIEIKKNNKVMIKGFLSDFIKYYKNNNKFIIDIYRNKYIIDFSCIITIYEIKFFHNKLNIF